MHEMANTKDKAYEIPMTNYQIVLVEINFFDYDVK